MRIGIRALDETKPHHARALPVATRVSVMRAALSNSSESAPPLGPDSGAVAINMQPVGNAGDVAPLGPIQFGVRPRANHRTAQDNVDVECPNGDAAIPLESGTVARLPKPFGLIQLVEFFTACFLERHKVSLIL